MRFAVQLGGLWKGQTFPCRIPSRRNLLLTLMLIGHLQMTFGYPAFGSGKSAGGVAYPCQSRKCGCLTSEQCWKGDCCCSTLEEKLAWADANGVEPPPHVRPMVESRRKASAAHPKAKSCCDHHAAVDDRSASNRSCCQKKAATCCSESKCDYDADAVCDHRFDSPKQTPSGVRWVVGIFAQKCKGEPGSGSVDHDPQTVPEATLIALPEVLRETWNAPHSVSVTSRTHRPPTPPPKLSV